MKTILSFFKKNYIQILIRKIYPKKYEQIYDCAELTYSLLRSELKMEGQSVDYYTDVRVVAAVMKLTNAIGETRSELRGTSVLLS